jgi:carboxymethylenebutenolidase
MNNLIKIKSADDLDLPIYIYEPSIKRIGAIVLIQEIFGVNDHIKNLAQKFTDEGFVTWVPDLYYRVQNDVNLSYTVEDINTGKELKEKLGWELPTMDILSCVANLKVSFNVATLGFCYGGTLSWKAACAAYGLDASVCFYGSQITNFLDKNPKCSTLVHLGEKDSTINKDDQNKIIQFSKNQNSDIIVHQYENADHGFFCDQRDSYHEKSYELAYKRTLDFLKNTL